MIRAAISVDGIKKRFGDVTALDGISFEVGAGEIFALLGPNGAGKTTAVRILTTNVRPDAGRATILGYDTATQPVAVRAHIGLAGQAATVDDMLTGRENLRLIGRLTHLRRRDIPGRVTELLARFGLTEAADRQVKTYSGGMRRRLDVAAALLHRPPVLFLDEPTTGLDLESRQTLWQMVRDLVAEGTTVLLTTQYLEEADLLAKHVAIIGGGRVVAEGTPAQLKARVGSAVVELGFADDALAVRACDALAGLRGAVPERDGSTLRLRTDDGAEVTMAAMTLLDRYDLRPSTLALREPSLDDAFLALTSRGDVDAATIGVAR